MWKKYHVMVRFFLIESMMQSFATMIMTISVMGPRIVVGDAQESLYFVTYKPADKRLLVFADDTSPRWTTCATMVDYQTIAAGDKFGNVFINRVGTMVSNEVDEDPTGAGE
jgi:splicing factor 3B subunit 3